MTNSHPIPVRVPTNLYEEIIASKPKELRLSTYLLTLIRKGLDAGVDSSQQNVHPDDAVIERIAGLEEQLAAIQRMVDDAQSVRIASLTPVVEKILEENQDARVQKLIQQQMEPVLGEFDA